MTDFRSFDSESIVPSKIKAITSEFLDDLKAFFYLYNAKPDTEIRLLKGEKIVQLQDIKNIEEQFEDHPSFFDYKRR